MKKSLKIILIIIVLLILGIALAGIYKFNYLANQDGYDADGNKIETQIANSVSTKTLEVLGVFGEMDGDSVELITLDENGKYNMGEKYSTIISIPNLGDDYVSLEMGDRVQITGEFSDKRIFSITNLTVVENPEKTDCEQAGRKWTPQGKAQIPACVSEYSDAGKTCTSSLDCEGNCVKTSTEKSAICESSSSQFGCKTTIENFEKGEGILCRD